MNIKLDSMYDSRAVEEVARNAFYNLYIPGASEHVIIHMMRMHPDYIPELSFVLEKDQEIIGGIFFTKSKIHTKSGELDTISFGPVFIDSKHQRKGYGKILITHAIEQATKMGYTVITTLGYPYHYEPYGFKGGKQYGVSMSDANYYKGLLVLELVKGTLDNIQGFATFSNALEVNEEEINKYDSTFSYLEKKVMPSQKEFEIACVQLDK